MTDEGQEGREVAVPNIAGIQLQPRNLGEAMELAKYLSVSSIIPHALRGKAADILVIIMYGTELGLSVNQALRGINVINGAPSLSAELRVAKTRERGHAIGVVCGVDIGGGRRCAEWAHHPIHGVPTDQDPGRHPFDADHTRERCTVKAVRKDTGETAIITWTIEDAIAAQLIKRAESGDLVARSARNEPLPWELYPADMLYNRASDRAAKRIAPEVAFGLYTEEETERIPTRVEATVGAPVDEGPPADPDELRRQAEATQNQFMEG